MNIAPITLQTVRASLTRALYLLAAVSFFLPSFASGQEPEKAPVDAHVWGALVYGGPDERPFSGEVPDDFPAIVSSLKKVFSHPHFSLLGHHTQGIFRQYESWVVPSKELFLKIDSKGRTSDGRGLNIHLQVWQGKKVLVKTDATLMPGNPLFIAGPRWGEGQLYFVVNLKS